MRALCFSVLAIVVLTACGRSTNGLPGFGVITLGQAERDLVTAQPLILPSNLTALPQPTPGGANRAGINPELRYGR